MILSIKSIVLPFCVINLKNSEKRMGLTDAYACFFAHALSLSDSVHKVMSKLLRDIEKFHSTLTNILSEEFTISMSQILKQINEISIELTQIEVSLKELDVPKRIAESTLKVYAQTQNQINELDLFQHKRRQGNRRDNLRRHNNRSRNCKGSSNAK